MKAIEYTFAEESIATGAALVDIDTFIRGSAQVKNQGGRGVPHLFGYSGFGENAQRFVLNHDGWRKPGTPNMIDDLGFSPGSTNDSQPMRWITPIPLNEINEIITEMTQDSGGAEDANVLLAILYPDYDGIKVDSIEVQLDANNRLMNLPSPGTGRLRVFRANATPGANTLGPTAVVGTFNQTDLLADKDYVILAIYGYSATDGALRILQAVSPDWPGEINPVWIGRGDVGVGDWPNDYINPISLVHSGSNVLTVEAYNAVAEDTIIHVFAWEY